MHLELIANTLFGRRGEGRGKGYDEFIFSALSVCLSQHKRILSYSCSLPLFSLFCFVLISANATLIVQFNVCLFAISLFLPPFVVPSSYLYLPFSRCKELERDSRDKSEEKGRHVYVCVCMYVFWLRAKKKCGSLRLDPFLFLFLFLFVFVLNAKLHAYFLILSLVFVVARFFLFFFLSCLVD